MNGKKKCKIELSIKRSVMIFVNGGFEPIRLNVETFITNLCMYFCLRIEHKTKSPVHSHWITTTTLFGSEIHKREKKNKFPPASHFTLKDCVAAVRVVWLFETHFVRAHFLCKWQREIARRTERAFIVATMRWL